MPQNEVILYLKISVERSNNKFCIPKSMTICTFEHITFLCRQKVANTSNSMQSEILREIKTLHAVSKNLYVVSQNYLVTSAIKDWRGNLIHKILL
jgi:hypothetical protein